MGCFTLSEKVYILKKTIFSMPKRKGGEGVKSSDYNIEKALVENIVELQKVHANLAEKFDSLAKQISRLLELFESTAKSYSQNSMQANGDKDFIEKIDKLLEQNKTLAKGLSIVEERTRNEESSEDFSEHHENNFKPSPSGRPLPRV